MCHGLTTLIKSAEENGSPELESLSDEVIVLGETARALLPILFKFVMDTHEAAASSNQNNPVTEGMDVEDIPTKTSTPNPIDSFQKLQGVSDAISSLARLAPDGFVKGLFKTLMQRLLEEVQSEKGDSERICALLTLSQALVASKVLDDSSISFLYRALKPLIRNDTDGARVQKRAYKVLNEICERHHTYVTDSERLYELSVLLTATIGTSQVSSRYMRLKCLTLIVDGFDESNKKQLVRFYVDRTR
jgi:ribosomal RNA-processing protein 12